jgi:hypothetical protein
LWDISCKMRDAGFEVSFRDCPAKGGTGGHPKCGARLLSIWQFGFASQREETTRHIPSWETWNNKEMVVYKSAIARLSNSSPWTCYRRMLTDSLLGSLTYKLSFVIKIQLSCWQETCLCLTHTLNIHGFTAYLYDNLDSDRANGRWAIFTWKDIYPVPIQLHTPLQIIAGTHLTFPIYHLPTTHHSNIKSQFNTLNLTVSLPTSHIRGF